MSFSMEVSNMKRQTDDRQLSLGDGRDELQIKVELALTPRFHMCVFIYESCVYETPPSVYFRNLPRVR